MSIYAPPSSEAFKRPTRSEPALSPLTVALKPPQERCIHKGAIVDGVIYCGHCAVTGAGVDPWDLFVLSFDDVCERIARSIDFESIPYEDRKQHAFLTILENMKIIIGARNPYGMAFKIAQCNVRDMTRKACYWHEWPVSQLTITRETDAGQKAREARIEDFADKMQLQYFPGVRLLWKPKWLHPLEGLLDDAFGELSSTEQMVIKTYYGFYEECGPLTQEECAKVYNMSRDQVRYAIEKAVKTMRKSMKQGASKLITDARRKQ
jgi:DNA-directed RNA polymerase specialized sigma24 family protein